MNRVNPRRSRLRILLLLMLPAIAPLMVGCKPEHLVSGHLYSTEIFPDRNVRQLIAAARSQDEAAFDRIVRSGVDVNHQGLLGITPISWLVVQSDFEGFRFLLERGARTDLRNEAGSALIHQATANADGRFLQELLLRKVDIDDVQPNTMTRPIFIAISYTNTNAVRALIEAGADLRVTRGGGDDPVLAAALIGKFDIVHALLETGRVNLVTNRLGETLFTFLEKYGGSSSGRQALWRARVEVKAQQMFPEAAAARPRK